MMQSVTINASVRTVTGRQVGALRRAGQLPAVVYGPGREPVAVQLDAREAKRILSRIRGAQLIDLALDGQTRKTLVREIQRDYVKGDLLHVDFYEVAMDRTLRVNLPIDLVGSAPGVTSGEGVLVRGLATLEIECLPGDLISHVDIDLGELKAVGQALYVRDLYLPKSIKVHTDPDELVARITFARAEEVPAAEAEAAVTPEVEVIKKGKEEEEEIEAGGEAAKKAEPAKKK